MLRSLQYAFAERLLFVFSKTVFFVTWVSLADVGLVARITSVIAFVSVINVVLSLGTKGHLTKRYFDNEEGLYEKILFIRIAVACLLTLLIVTYAGVNREGAHFYFIAASVLLSPFELTQLRAQLEKRNMILLKLGLISTAVRLVIIITMFRTQEYLELLVLSNLLIDTGMLMVTELRSNSSKVFNRRILRSASTSFWNVINSSLIYLCQAVLFIVTLRLFQLLTMSINSDLVMIASVGIATTAINVIYPVIAGLIAAAVPYAHERQINQSVKFKYFIMCVQLTPCLSLLLYLAMPDFIFNDYNISMMLSYSLALLALLVQNLISSKVAILNDSVKNQIKINAIALIITTLYFFSIINYIQEETQLMTSIALYGVLTLALSGKIERNSDE